MLTILSGGGNVSGDQANHFRAIVGAKTTGYLLPHLDHVDIPLNLIVIKWHLKISQKGQRHGFMGL